MAGTGIQIDMSQVNAAIAQLQAIPTTLPALVDAALAEGATGIAALAKRRAPKDNGDLAKFTNPKKIADLQYEVVAGMPYSAYIEFGTGKYAAQYVATLPSDWASYAAEFKGKGGPGTFADMVRHLAEWVKRKGIAGTYSVKTRRRTGKKANFANEDLEVAYRIARAILRNGIHAQPFLYPSVVDYTPTLIQRLNEAINLSLGNP